MLIEFSSEFHITKYIWVNHGELMSLMNSICYEIHMGE